MTDKNREEEERCKGMYEFCDEGDGSCSLEGDMRIRPEKFYFTLLFAYANHYSEGTALILYGLDGSRIAVSHRVDEDYSFLHGEVVSICLNVDP